MASQAGDWWAQGERAQSDGGTMAPGVPDSPGGSSGFYEGIGPGEWQDLASYWEGVWEEMKDLANDALGG